MDDPNLHITSSMLCPYCYLENVKNIKMDKAEGNNFKCRKCKRITSKNGIINKWKEIKNEEKLSNKNIRP